MECKDKYCANANVDLITLRVKSIDTVFKVGFVNISNTEQTTRPYFVYIFINHINNLDFNVI